MQVKYNGNYPIKFISAEYNGVVKPNESIEMSDALYNAEYKNDSRWSAGNTPVKKEKIKEDKNYEGVK